MKTIKNISIATICGDIKQTYVLKICVVMTDSNRKEEFRELLVTPDEFRTIIMSDNSPQVSNYYFKDSKLEIDSTVILKSKEEIVKEFNDMKCETIRVSNIGFTSFECLKALCYLNADLVVPYVESKDLKDEAKNMTLTDYFSEQQSLIEDTPEIVKYYKIPLRRLKPAKTTQRIMIDYVLDNTFITRKIGSYTTGKMIYEILQLELTKDKFTAFLNNPNVKRSSISDIEVEDNIVRFKIDLNEYIHLIDSPYYHQNLINIFSKDITKMEYYKVRLEAYKFIKYILCRVNHKYYPMTKAESFGASNSDKLFGIVSVSYESGFRPSVTIDEYNKMTDAELNKQISRMRYLRPAAVNNYYNSLYDNEIYNLLNNEDLTEEYVDEQIQNLEMLVSDYALTNFRDRYLAYKYKGEMRQMNRPLLVGNLKINIGGH